MKSKLTGTSTLIQIQSCLLAIQDSSKYPPFFLTYGRYATLPIDILSDQRKTTSTNYEVQMTDEQIHEKSKQLIELSSIGE